MNRIACSAFALASVALAATSAVGSVVATTVADVSSGDYTLTSVSVSRGSAGTFTYLPNQLTGVTLTDVDAYQSPLLVPRNAPLPAVGSRVALIEDAVLDTGVVNITTTNGSADRSVEIVFASPVVNSVGEDILLFEIGGDDGIRWWVNNDRAGQGEDVLNSRYTNNLISGIPFTLISYSNNGNLNVLSLEELEGSTGWGSGTNASGNLAALGLDLSAVGVPLGGSVSSIRFQSLAGNGGRVDPVLIVGLPAVPEPGGLLLAGLAAGALAGRRRRA